MATHGDGDDTEKDGGSRYAFARFEDDDHVVIRGRSGLKFHIAFDSDPCFVGDHTITAYAKLFPTDEDCVCLDEDNRLCRCNWNYEITSSAADAKECIEAMMARIANVTTCAQCQRTFASYEGSTRCGSCFLQDVLDRDLPVVLNCPVCYEDIKETHRHVLSRCSHALCIRCYDSLPRIKPCPMCRTTERIVTDDS